MLNNDNEIYEKELLSMPWVTKSNYLDIEKMRKNLPSLNYFIKEDANLNVYCTEKVIKHVLSKSNLFESKNAKNLVRAGVPCQYMREFLIKLLGIDTNPDEKYFQKFIMVFKQRDPKYLEDYVPYFTGYKTLKESLPVDFLNEEGIQTLKEILWLLNSNLTSIEFSPLIIKIISLFLIFCTKSETYSIMRKLIDVNYNLKEMFKLRWHFRFVFSDNVKLINSVSESIKEISSKSEREILMHLDSLNFPLERLYEDMIFNFFFDYLNFEGILRFFPLFLTEGVKSVYRMCYAILKTLKTEILQTKSADSLIVVIREKSKSITDLNKLFNVAFGFKLTRFNNKYDDQSAPNVDIFAGKRTVYSLPNFNEKSDILLEKEIIKLWSVLPSNLRIKDFKLVYSTETNGYSLHKILTCFKPKTDYEVLFIIETQSNEVFGGFLSQSIRHTNNKYERPFQSLLISIRPYITVYEAVKSSDNIFFCDSECLIFGEGSEGPAIRIDKDLKKGFSHSGTCFNAPALVCDKNGDFIIKKMEVYTLS